MLAVESGMLKVGALYIMGRLLLGALILFSKGTIQAGVLTHKSMMLLRIRSIDKKTENNFKIIFTK